MQIYNTFLHLVKFSTVCDDFPRQKQIIFIILVYNFLFFFLDLTLINFFVVLFFFPEVNVSISGVFPFNLWLRI